jgi:hypothetical protein
LIAPMIRTDKLRHALYALHSIMTHARLMAYERRDHDLIAEVLDWAELLPGYIDAERDCTDRFRSALKVITSCDPRLSSVLIRFDDAEEPYWHGEDRD